MKRRLLWIVLALGLATVTAGTADAQGLFSRQRMAAKKAEEERPIDLQTIETGARKLTESYGGDARQAIDIYIPPHARNAPILVMVHGGAWMVGDKANTGSVENKLKHWLPKGFIVVSVNYRMLPDIMAYEQAEDVAHALAYVEDHAAGWGGDAGKLILMGHSAGAHIVALISSAPEMVGRPWAGTVVLDSAVMDVPAVMGRRHLGFYDKAFGQDPAYWRKASPLDRWTPKAVPMMLVCSTKRPDRPCDAADAFHDKAEKAGKSLPVFPRALTHEEVNRTLGLPGDYTDAVDAFIAQRLAN
jgi:acetyl esterase/lipase